MSKPYIRTTRKKPRPGRLKGEDLAALRAQCFLRDGCRCQHVVGYTLVHGRPHLCGKVVTWEGPMAGHMHHIRNKRMWGDTLENVTTLCAKCHAKIHNAGGKPVPAKEK